MRGKKILNFNIIAISFTVLMLAFVAVTPSVFAAHCTTTITSASSIQTTLDAASSGDVICLDDSGGVFSQQVVFDAADSGITLTALHDTSPVLDGTGVGASTTNSAITLLGGVIDVTIQGLEIRDYIGDSSSSDRSSGIVAAFGTTSGITVKQNYIHDNFWNGILVFSEGDFMHDNWTVEKNTATDNGFIGIELTNTKESEIVRNNAVDNGLHGILVQVRNGLSSGETPRVFDIAVVGNNVSGSSSDGIRLLAFQFGDNTAEITDDCEVTKNNVHENGSGIRLGSFGAGSLIVNCVVENNNVQNNTGEGIRILTRSSGLVEFNDVVGNRVSDNGGDGINVTGDKKDIDDNKENNNGGDGINVTGEDNSIENNKANGNTDDGIDCLTAAGNTESGNKAKGNGGTDNTDC